MLNGIVIYDNVELGKRKGAAKRLGDAQTGHQLKASLDDGLAKLLNEEQLSKWTEASAFRSGGSAKSARGEGKREGKKGGQKRTPTN